MHDEESKDPKVLLVVTGAFGELFMAMYFVMGQTFRTAFALCDTHFALNHATLPGPAHRYSNLADLLAIVRTEKPDLVCLFSGYLLVHDRIMQVDEITALLDQLRRNRIKVITSDPFLGLPSRLPMYDVRNPIEQFLSGPLSAAGEVLFGSRFAYLMKMVNRLKHIPHLYVVDPMEPGEVRRLSFFNRNLCGLAGAKVSANVRKKDWVFILAASEYTRGRDSDPGFIPLLAKKLRETLAEGCRPVMIAPQACIKDLSTAPALKDALLLSECEFNQYVSLLTGAEYVFYWNVFSASVIACMLNRRPTFFFGLGHVAQASSFIFDKGFERYYAGAKLTYLDQNERLRRADLEKQAAMQDAQLFTPFLKNMSYLPSPDDLVRQLVEN